jgi:cytochrome c1
MALAALPAALLASAFLCLQGCQPPSPRAAREAGAGGDALRGARVMTRQSCGACHEIPGLQDADGLVGPPLTHFSRRTMIAGLLPNTPDNLEYWLRQPQAVTPGNGMPDLGLSDRDARDIAAYLYRIR